MSDEPRQHTGDDEPWTLEPVGADDPASAPKPAPEGHPEKPQPKIEAQPILELEEEQCPKCRAPLGPGDVVCLKCGYDMRANTVRQVEHRAESVDEEPDESDAEPFVTPGRGSPKVLLIAGSILSIAAMVVAGMGVPTGGSTWLVVASVLLVLYEVVLHTGTGLVAVAAAARISEERFGGEEAVQLAAARVFVAMAVFELVLHLVGMTPYTLVSILAWPLAGAAYWLVVWLLFNKTKTVALVIVLAQVILWVLVRLGMEIAGWREGALAAIS